MSLSQKPSFEFGSDLPLNPIEGGTNVLVTGPTDAGLKPFVHELLAVQPGEGLVAVSTEEDGRQFRRAQERVAGGLDDDCLGVVECDGSISSGECVTSVSGPDDLTAITMQLSSLADELTYDGVDDLRTGLYSVAPLVAAADDVRDVYRFLQNAISRNRRGGGLFVCGIDPESSVGEMGETSSIVSGISTAFHGRIELRQTGGRTEMRVDGLDDQPEGWHEVRL
jgi:hypothetical protein